MAWKRKYIVDNTYFEKIDNEHKAYWLGLIYADGCLAYNSHTNYSYLDITLKESDGYLLNKFVEDMHSTYPVKIKPNNLNKMCASLQIYSSKIAKNLIALGVYRNKTQHCLFPKEDVVSINLLPHFIRGFMDGDGSISISNKNDFSLKFIGTYEMMEGIKTFFKRDSIIHKVKKCKVPIYTFEIHGNRETEKSLHMIYDNSIIFMQRKYNRYLQLLNINNNNDMIKQKKKDNAEKEIIALYKQGYSYQNISDKTQHSTSFITDILKPIRNEDMLNIDKVILEMFKNGSSKLEICKITGRSRDYIRQLVSDIDIINNNKEKEIRNEILGLYKQGLPKKTISNQLNISYKKVVYTINKYYNSTGVCNSNITDNYSYEPTELGV